MFLVLIKVVGKGKIIIWFYQLRIMYIGHCIEILKLIFSTVTPLSIAQMKGLMLEMAVLESISYG